jgi:hypothetical protein
MKTEAELRELHTRLVAVLVWANKPGTGLTRKALRELANFRVQLDWLLESDTKASTEWAARIFRQLNNLEGLRRTYEVSRNQ